MPALRPRTAPGLGQYPRWPKGQPERALYHCGDCGAGIESTSRPSCSPPAAGSPPIPSVPSPGSVNALYTPIGLGLTWANSPPNGSGRQRPARQKTFHGPAPRRSRRRPHEKLDEDDHKTRAGIFKPRDIPLGCLALTAGVDVQKDRFCHPHHRAREGGQMGHRLRGAPRRSDHRGSLDRPGRPPRPAPDQQPRSSHAPLPGGHRFRLPHRPRPRLHRTRRGRVVAVKGASTPGKPIINRPSKLDVTVRGKTIKHGAEGWLVGGDTAAHVLFAVLTADGKRPPRARPPDPFPGRPGRQFLQPAHRQSLGPNRRRWVKGPAPDKALDTGAMPGCSPSPSLRIHLWKEPHWAHSNRFWSPRPRTCFRRTAHPNRRRTEALRIRSGLGPASLIHTISPAAPSTSPAGVAADGAFWRRGPRPDRTPPRAAHRESFADLSPWRWAPVET